MTGHEIHKNIKVIQLSYVSYKINDNYIEEIFYLTQSRYFMNMYLNFPKLVPRNFGKLRHIKTKKDTK